MEERIPNFFIVGAPKCGTTALYSYLKEHPSIFMPRDKEPHYYAEDFSQWRFVSDEQAYRDLFSSAEDGCSCLGEASPWYLYSKTAIKNIQTANPEAKLIIMLRDPIEMVYAQYYQNIYNLDEEQSSFDAALSLESERREGRSVPAKCRSREMLYYSEIGRFASQLQACWKVFPKEQTKVVLFDDLVKSSEQVYLSVLEFLGLENDFRESFPRVNANQTRQFQALASLSERPPAWVANLANRLRQILGVEELGLYRFVRGITSKTRSREEISIAARQRLCELYQDEVVELSKMLNRDLSNWCCADAGMDEIRR